LRMVENSMVTTSVALIRKLRLVKAIPRNHEIGR
jgi:hypothetical protein